LNEYFYIQAEMVDKRINTNYIDASCSYLHL